MKPALLLIDLQHDYLAAPGLQPPRDEIVRQAGALLKLFRRRQWPVIHIHTTVTRAPDNRMPHWQAQGRWHCVAGTPGHETPCILQPSAASVPAPPGMPTPTPPPPEWVIDKQYFSGFADPRLHALLQEHGRDTLVLAGIHLHACVRATALDAYALGYRVILADDATGSDDPLHAAITRRYLADRAMTFLPVAAIAQWCLLPGGTGVPPVDGTAADAPKLVHHNPARRDEVVWDTPCDVPAVIARRAAAVKAAWHQRVDTTIMERAAVLRRLADLVAQHEAALAGEICTDVGKPITQARAEVRRSIALLLAGAEQASAPQEAATSPTARYRHMPLGLVALITPWNNPLAIPVGKIAPAYLYDNAVIWKPAPAGTRVARSFGVLCHIAGLTALELVVGDHDAALALARAPHVDALTLTGGAQAGYALQEIAARRHLPYQAELGGNNAAIVADDYPDRAGAVAAIVTAAYGFAGQRCTANRRLIVPRSQLDEYWSACAAQIQKFPWGDPREEATLAGPVISAARRQALGALLDRVQADADKANEADEANGAARAGQPTLRLLRRDQPQPPATTLQGYYAPLALVLCDDPAHEIVQEESFGPILVLQPADDFAHALRLCNAVRQGLVAALYSHDPQRQQQFLRHAQAGILKLNQPTVEADAVSPFGGWKSSAVGPFEHGPSDREFFTRTQTIYGK